MSDAYQEALQSAQGTCACPALAHYYELGAAVQELRREYHRLTFRLKTKEKGSDYWGLFWEHKATRRDLQELLKRYAVKTVLLIDSGDLHLRSHFYHPQRGVWCDRRLGWDAVSDLLAIEDGIVTIHCSHCGQLIAVSGDNNRFLAGE